MTAPLTAAESFLALLGDLDGAKPNGATAAVLLAHAAAHMRALLELAGDLERERDNLRALYAEARSAQDVPRPGVGAQGDPATGTALPRVITGPGHPDLSHLPPMAGPGEPACAADSPRAPGGNYWTCTGKPGHPERWHAEHDRDGTPYAAQDHHAAWPVTDKETGLPPMALAFPLGCGATVPRGDDDAWVCNAVHGHAPLDHVVFGGLNSGLPGVVLARWPSVHPVATCGALSPDGQMTCGLMAGHLSQHEQLDAAGGVTGGWADSAESLPPDLSGDLDAIPANRIGEAAPLPPQEPFRHLAPVPDDQEAAP